MFASAMGLWFVSSDGSFFCIIVWLDLFSMMLVFVFAYNNVLKREIAFFESYQAYFLVLSLEFCPGLVFCCWIGV